MLWVVKCTNFIHYSKLFPKYTFYQYTLLSILNQESSELQINSDIERCIVKCFISYHTGKKERKKCSFFRIFEKYVGIVPLFLFMIHGCNTSCVWKRNVGYLKGLLLSYDWNRMHANIIEVVCTYLCKILFLTLSQQ